MQTGNITTPFGRRPMTLALVQRQSATANIKPGKAADKWKILRDASAAMSLLGVQSNSLSVLDALLSFYPETELRQDASLIVFPSNLQLGLRAHGMAGATLRRHIAVLVQAGLITRKDSANGKRFARKDSNGEIDTAYGFDLSPLLARSEELAVLAQTVIDERTAFKNAKEALTVCRRDVRKLISVAIEEDVEGDWQAIEAVYVALVARIPRKATRENLMQLLEEMKALQARVVKHMETNGNTRNKSANDAQIERHIQNSNTNSLNELEPCSEEEQAGKLDAGSETESLPKANRNREQLKAFPLSMVLRACPMINDYGPGGKISNWRELMTAAIVVRSMLGVSPSAYEQACAAMGPENAAVAISCILERANFINSPGGYLRDLTKRTERGEFSLGPMVIALLKANGEGNLQTA
ncbi:plasmid replication protein RepC (plasmid) [Agrobacterium rosae]|uniref:Plasmid replication protein RepC n=1 Tax=Agrobacterium rosae TaxID=1972867 RepID=A0AAE5VMD8_9HYPH|nr:plasmid replication protein RepC [Agrobacterium rosae]KAA3509170.1 replication initiation protein RepC [Agrobacterium rosae]KAA3513864.1 replication initiation protein RepC [Agrobacterium rosae]MBN7808206.1 replication initiation protein RepC [Agrobacterium rosae]MDX8331727.1 plasmid replication protein RepC [Agrobacterium rosae]MQB50881.1 replication initiation protein RepC [Agrobacterium rosae]